MNRRGFLKGLAGAAVLATALRRPEPEVFIGFDLAQDGGGNSAVMIRGPYRMVWLQDSQSYTQQDIDHLSRWVMEPLS